MAAMSATSPTAGRVPLGYRFLAVLAIAVERLLRWRIDVTGTEHVPADGGAVLTWNHTGHVDVAVTALPILRATGRWVRFLALRQLWANPFLGWIPRLAHCVPVDRDDRRSRDVAFREAVGALEAGHLVMVAPEGRISGSDELLPFRTGAVRMAQAAGVPIVPTVSWGSHRFVTAGRHVSLRRGWRLPVIVRVGEPVHVDVDADPAAATERLYAVVAGLLEEARAAWPDDRAVVEDDHDLDRSGRRSA